MLSKDHHCLESIIEAADRIIEYTSGIQSADELNDDCKSFDAALMNFVIIGEMVAKLSKDFKKKHSEIEWVKIKGLRNIVAHDYFGVDAEEVWQIIRYKIPVLKQDCQQLLDE